MRIHSIHLFVYIISYFFFFSCGESLPEKNEGFKTEIENRKITRVTDGQLMEYASLLGKKILDTLSKENDSLLLTAICHNYNFSILKKTTTNIDTSTKEYKIYDAYAYNIENGLSLEDNMQQSGNEFLYTRPVIQNERLLYMWLLKMSKKELIKKYSLDENLKLTI